MSDTRKTEVTAPLSDAALQPDAPNQKRRARTLPNADTLAWRLVAGDRMTMTLAEFAHRCAVRIEEEQRKLEPDTACIALWCEAIRLTREVCDEHRAI